MSRAMSWGYGKYELEEHHIAKARHIVAVHEQGEENDNLVDALQNRDDAEVQRILSEEF